MRIEKFNNLRSIVLTKTAENNKITTKAAEQKNQTKDTYTFQTQAKELSELFKLAKNSEVVREEKLEKIREKLENSEYQVKGKDVVLKVLGEKLNGAQNN